MENNIIVNKLLTRQDLIAEAKQEERQIICDANVNVDKDTLDQFVEIGAWNGFAPGYRIVDLAICAANWAIKNGGRIGHSKVDPLKWLDIWNKFCSTNADICLLDINVDMNRSLWEYINTKYQNNRLTQVVIGTNSGFRCWWLCLIYLLIGQESL